MLQVILYLSIGKSDYKLFSMNHRVLRVDRAKLHRFVQSKELR